ncbi:cell wall-associated hydrolase [Mycobacterium tuberculosis]|nr:cell wall-associated hydrolase [Mycobacterium tuberculosis]
MRKYSLLSLLTGGGCFGVLFILAMFVAVVAVATNKILSPFGLNAQSVCGPGNAPGPEQLSNAPEPSPSTSGPSLLPAAYVAGPMAGPLDAGSAQNAALAPKNGANSIPSGYFKLYKAAASDKRFGGIPWYLLAGIGEVETEHGGSDLPGVKSGENYAGAGGPMQFLQGTWNDYAIDGPTFGPGGEPDGEPDGMKDRYDPADAIFSAANYLHHKGAPGNTRKAIYAYNNSWHYVDLVLSWAEKYSRGDFTLDDPNYAGFSCGASDSSASELGKRIIEGAEKWLGTRYVWGGGNINGPTAGGFDCSGLALYAVYHATGGQIKLPRVAADQQRDPRGKRVSRSELQPGDLVFFTAAGKTDAHHVGIYVGGGKMVNAPHTGAVVRVEAIGWKEFSGGVRFTTTVKA